MNLFKKLTTAAAVSMLLASPAMAEQITIGAEVPPVASLIVLGGNTNLDMDALVTLAGAAPATSVPAAKFFVNTNMPKWNVFLAWANGGVLQNSNGSLDILTGWLSFDTDLQVDNGAAAGDCGNVAYTDVPVNGAVDIAIGVANGGLQSMLTLVTASAIADPSGINWFQSCDVNTFGVDVSIAANGETPPTLAGQYTEILYATLATSY
jgi:hypothetical protein